MVVLVGVISSIVTMLIIAFVQGLCLQWENSLIDLNSRQDAYPGVTAVLDSQKQRLEADPEEGRLSVEAVIPDVLAKYKNDSHEDHSAGDNDSHADGEPVGEHDSASGEPH